jgi:hypothetical protein
MKKGRVANFHGQASDASAYVWTVQGSLAWDGSHDVFHENKLPYICSMYDTGFKVLSMKINYLAPFKHKHKYQKLAHEQKWWLRLSQEAASLLASTICQNITVPNITTETYTKYNNVVYIEFMSVTI